MYFTHFEVKMYYNKPCVPYKIKYITFKELFLRKIMKFYTFGIWLITMFVDPIVLIEKRKDSVITSKWNKSTKFEEYQEHNIIIMSWKEVYFLLYRRILWD